MEPVTTIKESEGLVTSGNDRNNNFMKDLVMLEERATRYFEQLMKFDINFEEDCQEALVIAQRLRSRVDDLIKDHLGGGEEKDVNKELRLEDLKIAVERVRDWKGEDNIGDRVTHIAMKNHNSYLVGTYGSGLQVVESGEQVYSGELPIDDNFLRDIVYVPLVKSYFIASRYKPYRKAINDKPPSLYMDVLCGSRYGAYLRYSEINQKLIINKDRKNISVINPKTKKIDIEVKKIVGKDVRDFRLFGEKENRVVAVTWDGYLLLYGLKYAQRSGSLISNQHLELIEERMERPKSIAVCEKNKYVFLEIGQSHNPFICSRLVILKLSYNTFTKMASIDQFSQKIGEKYAFECFGYAERHILWVGLSRENNGFVQIYSYDTQAGELRELEDKRIKHQECEPYKLHRVREKFYYTGKNGKLLSLSASI